MERAYYSKSVGSFLKQSNSEILGEIVINSGNIDVLQRNAWEEQIEILKRELSAFVDGHLLFEYTIPRVGKRVDVVLIYNGIVFILEFKVGSYSINSADKKQVEDYALDLKNFHEESHQCIIVPILVATKSTIKNFSYEISHDKAAV